MSFVFFLSQLHQQPSEENPIFLPSDSETDWMLAKIFLKNVYALKHQSIVHLLNTHFLAEAYIVAALRSLPEIHPIYKVRFFFSKLSHDLSIYLVYMSGYAACPLLR